MKKVLLALLAFVFVFAISSCENNTVSEDENLYNITATGDDECPGCDDPREDEPELPGAPVGSD